MFCKTLQADSGKVVKTLCQRIFKKNCTLKVKSSSHIHYCQLSVVELVTTLCKMCNVVLY